MGTSGCHYCAINVLFSVVALILPHQDLHAKITTGHMQPPKKMENLPLVQATEIQVKDLNLSTLVQDNFPAMHI
jgi:hypothetical protein